MGVQLAIGADGPGQDLKQVIAELLMSRGVTFIDVDGEVLDKWPKAESAQVDYPDIALAVATGVRNGRFERGILICGTGIGMAIAANKVKGIRAAQAHDVYSAERARKSNAAQILTLGARVIGPELAKSIVQAWLDSEFAGGESTRKVAKIEEIEA